MELTADAREGLSLLLADIAGSLSATDTAAIETVASSMNVVSAGGSDLLTPASRGALSGAATSLLDLRAVQSDQRLAGNVPCGDGLCRIPDEHCGSCPQDCGQCASAVAASDLPVTVEVGHTAMMRPYSPCLADHLLKLTDTFCFTLSPRWRPQAVGSWISGSAGFGTLDVSATLNDTDSLGDQLNGTSLSFSWLDKRTIRRGSEVLSDPTLTNPSTHMFAGVSFALATAQELNFTGANSNSTDVATRVVEVQVLVPVNATNSTGANFTNATVAFTESVAASGFPFSVNLQANVRIGLEGYSRRVSPTANLSLWRYDGESASWRSPDCDATSSDGQPIDVFDNKWSFAGVVCGKGQFAVFVQMNEGGVGINSVEENIVTSIGEVLVRTTPSSGNGTNATASAGNSTAGNSTAGSGGDATGSANGTNANGTDPEAAAFAQENNNRVLAVLESVAKVISNELASDDPEAVVDTPKVTMAAGKKGKDQLGNARTVLPGVNPPAVTLPPGFGDALPPGASSASVSLTALKDNPYSWSNTANMHSDVVALGVKLDDGTNVSPDSLDDDSGIELIIPISAIPGVPRTSNYPVVFDPTKPISGCEPANASHCFGAWSTVGLEEDLSEVVAFRRRRGDGDTDSMKVKSKKGSGSYGASATFVIEAPRVSAANFDPRNSFVIYAAFGSLFFVVGLVGLYSRAERRAYDERQLLITRGEINDEEDTTLETDLEPAPRTGWLSFYPFLAIHNFFVGLKTKHQWIALFWPAGKRVYPKRIMKVLSVFAGTSLTMGLNAVFSFTATAQAEKGADPKRVNSLIINTKYGEAIIPLDGIYTFVSCRRL